jgi:hypothetical protein
MDSAEYKHLVMRKLYSFMKKKCPQGSKGDIREKVLRECQGFFSGETSMGLLINFMRNRL